MRKINIYVNSSRYRKFIGKWALMTLVVWARSLLGENRRIWHRMQRLVSTRFRSGPDPCRREISTLRNFEIYRIGTDLSWSKKDRPNDKSDYVLDSRTGNLRHHKSLSIDWHRLKSNKISFSCEMHPAGFGGSEMDAAPRKHNWK